MTETRLLYRLRLYETMAATCEEREYPRAARRLRELAALLRENLESRGREVPTGRQTQPDEEDL